MAACRTRLATAFAATLVAALLVPAAAPGSHNDLFADRVALDVGDFEEGISNAAATTTGENFFVPGTASTCPDTGAQMVNTLWWTISAGNSGRVTVTTDGSNFDTVLALYRGVGGQSAPFPLCDDDVHGASVRSRLRLTVQPGFEYPIQVGGCTGLDECGDATGEIAISVVPTPANDDRAQAIAVAPGASSPRVATEGATLEAGERRACGARPFDKTVWFSFRAPSTGIATLEATGFDTVISLYEGSAGQPVRCVDDPASGDQATLVHNVRPGLYFVQVGGYGQADADFGPLTLSTRFVDPDPDDDGARGADDCDETNPLRSRLKPEIVNNALDENCDGIPAFDRDGDRHLAPPAGRDCRDDLANVNPGARDVRGNDLDEDCVNGPDPFLRLPSTIRARYFEAFPKTRFRRLIVKKAEAGSRITVTCKGRRCPFRRRVRDITRDRDTVKLHTLFRKRLVPPGVVLEVRVTKPEHFGVGRRFKTRRGGLPGDDDLCHNPTTNRWRRC